VTKLSAGNHIFFSGDLLKVKFEKFYDGGPRDPLRGEGGEPREGK
jgi:hypothetical protein